ncbi:DEAD/DEAH box helicase family protein [Curtobacterium sp. MCBD17_003]|uniref:DEAD/DEAH box helicase n=1 Tax=Curtobacterium sp. MCBD17_003 TaxID=2175667 RepID=UPI001C64968D|nr:DEAD/DEAH box helicase family protein [Curtobacterium sp. MCBD17_003]WIE56303.1 DEAD/DEAH box helicase family protein [Curtobacterium sp. MCBD17_003]
MITDNAIKNSDLVLTVSASVDPTVFDIGRYEAFLDALSGNREYQKDAIRTVLRFLLGNRYANTRALFVENYENRDILQQAYGALGSAEKRLTFPDQLSCSVDLATGTGKSYVLYGLAAIMLAEGKVDQVLVLTPSTTIESGLMDKFRALSVDETLRAAMPTGASIIAPSVINGNESLVSGSICVENYHAVFPSSRSSLRPTLAGKGARTLILNDEAHHVYSGNGDMRRWAEFVGDSDLAFKYVVGLSGTCYTNDSYFPDVVARYSLRQAIDDGVVKTIDYVAEDSAGGRDEKFQKIYDNHVTNKNQTYRKVKPLTLLVTSTIAACKRVTSELIAFISNEEGIPVEEAALKVLAVTSDPDHRANLVKLPQVDRPESAVEWITSVSMLTEGWDVKNVFQVVPHEERAFSSKLLVSQVLGRGLRVPDEYKGERPVVTVFNHDAWSGRIRHLVDEVLEIENRIYSEIVEKENDYNFTLHNIDYTKTQQTEEHEATGEYDFSKGYVSLVSQVKQLERETVYSRAVTGGTRQKRTLIKYQMFSISEVAEHIHAKFRAIDLEAETDYAVRYSITWLEALIKESLKRVGETADQVSEENRQRLQSAFGVVHRRASQTVRYLSSVNGLKEVPTSTRRRDSTNVSGLRRGDTTIFFDEDALELSDEGTAGLLKEIIEDDSLPRSAFEQIANKFNLRTPQNLVIANHRPERLFVKELVKQGNAQKFDGWIKSTDQDFYPIEYGWRKGEHFKRGNFNPDFLLKAGSTVLVIEIKGDDEVDDPSDENRAKFAAATTHFAEVNKLVEDVTYRFHFLTPKDYDAFFQFVREGKFDYSSSLDVVLAGE